MKEQLFAFASSLKEAGCAVAHKPRNWLEAFEGLKDLARQSNEKRKVIFIDELSWMLSKVVHNKGGLYNRLTEQIHLQTFTLRECEEYVKASGLALNRNQILQYY